MSGPVYAAVCPCCASSLVELARANGHPLAPLCWACVHCGFTLMGLAVPVRPSPLRQCTCLEVYEETKVRP